MILALVSMRDIGDVMRCTYGWIDLRCLLSAAPAAIILRPMSFILDLPASKSLSHCVSLAPYWVASRGISL